MDNKQKEQENRIEFLARTYNVFEMEELDDIRSAEGYKDYNQEIMDIDNKDVLAIISTIFTKESEYNGSLVKSYKKIVTLSERAFIDIVSADPTPKKFYSQWMIKTVVRMLKDNEIDAGRRFLCEDLFQARESLELFDGLKKKKTFKENASSYASILKIQDPCDINQYKTLSALYDVIDPFIVRDVSQLEKSLMHFVNTNQALMPIKDRICKVYIPLTLAASEILRPYVSWCTTPKGNSMFKSYTSNLTPEKRNSKLYVIIPNTVFTGETVDMFQLHVESRQFMNKSDSPVNMEEFKRDFLYKSDMLANYLYDTFLPLARKQHINNKTVGGKGSKDNVYYDILKKMGYGDILLDIMSDATVSISINSEMLMRPDFSRFKHLKFLVLINNKLKSFPESISKCESLELLTIGENQVSSLPDSFGNLTSLIFLNIFNNKVEHIPDSIRLLDPSNGGKLNRIAVREEEVGEDVYKKLKTLLPNVDFYSDIQ